MKKIFLPFLLLCSFCFSTLPGQQLDRVQGNILIRLLPNENLDNWDPANIDNEWGDVSECTAEFHGASPNQLRWDIVCGGEHENEHGEGLGFSRDWCDCCGSSLGGSRYALTALLVRK